MYKKLLAVALASIFGDRPSIARGRAMTNDVAFTYRMGAGSPGDVNRTHPCSVEPCLQDPETPITAYGQAGLIDTGGGVRAMAAGDTAVTNVWGFAVRPYPIGQQSTSNYGAVGFGAATPPTTQPIDMMRQGYMMVQCNAGAAPVKGGAVFIWVAATAGNNIQGQFQSVASGGNTCALDVNRYQFNGGVDANNVAEIVCR